jgi:hypothetical protein
MSGETSHEPLEHNANAANDNCYFKSETRCNLTVEFEALESVTKALAREFVEVSQTASIS